MRVGVDQFQGMVPLIDPAAMASSLAEVAVNAGFRRGRLGGIMFDLTPREDTWLKANVNGIDVRPRSIHYSHMADAWFQWSSESVFNLVDSPIAPLDEYGRLFFADETGPRYMTSAQYEIDTVNRNRSSYRLGVPVPPRGPTARKISEENPDDLEDAAITRMAVYYVATLVDDLGQEGAPSLASTDPVRVPTENDFEVEVSLSLSGLDFNARPFSSGQAKIRFYRLTSGSTAADYQYVGEVDWATSVTFTDTVPYGEEAEVIPTSDWEPAPEKIRRLEMMDNNYLAGFYESMICYSEVRVPYAWPTAYRFALPYQIVTITVCNGGLFIGTTGAPFWATGTDPAAAVPIKLDYDYPCLNQRGTVVINGVVYYPTHQGLAACDGNKVELVTSNLFSEEQWAALDPANIIAWENDGRYYFWAPGTEELWALEPFVDTSLTLVTTTIGDAMKNVISVGRDTRRDKTVLGFVSGTPRLASIEDATTSTVRWRSSEVLVASHLSMSAAMVQSTVWPVTLRVFANRQMVYEKVVTDSGLFRLPPGRYNRWQLELEFTPVRSADQVQSAVIAQSVGEVLDG